jgi:uncharacterized protein
VSLPSSAPPSRGAVAAAEQDLSDAEFAELDDLLAEIPEPLEPLDAVMLDGFLCGVLVQPELIADEAWLPFVFDAGGHRWGEAEPSPEQLRARSLILRRHAALNRSIAEFGAFDPFVLRWAQTPAPHYPAATPSRQLRSIRSAPRSCLGSPASSRRCTCCRAWPISTIPR